jgi:branched-chain amino acid transport system substrate-binding protein
MKGALLAVEEANANGGINGQQIQLVIEDTQSDLSRTALAVRKLAQVDHVPVIIGPTWAEFAQVSIPVIEDEKIVMISASAGGSLKEFESPYFFNTYPSERFEMRDLTAFMHAHAFDRVAVIYDLSPWSVALKEMFEAEAAQNGIQIVESFEIQPDEKDFRRIVTRLKELDIDGVFAPFNDESIKGIYLRQAFELGLSTRFFSTQSTQTVNLLKNTGQAAEGVIFAYPKETSLFADFKRRYEKRFNEELLIASTASAYDATNAVIAALKRRPRDTNQLISFLLETDFDGVSNHIQFDQYGLIQNKDYVIKTVQDGGFVVENNA